MKKGVQMCAAVLAAVVLATSGVHADARFKVMHAIAAANGPTVDVYTGMTMLIDGLEYGAESFYLTVPAGMYPISVKATGTMNEIFADNVTLADGEDHSVIAHGDGSGNPFALLTLTDDNDLPADAGQFHLRFIHASAGSPAVDIRANASVIFDDVSYGSTGSPVYLNIDAGTYAVDAVLEGTTTVVVGPLNIAFMANTIYTVVAHGIVSDGTRPLTVFLAQDATGQTADVRVVHAVADGAPTVDVYVYGQAAVEDFDFNDATPYVSLPAQKTYLEVKLAGTDTVAIGPVEATLAAGADYTIVAHGGNGEALALLILADDNTAPAEGMAHLRFVHASAGSPEVTVRIEDKDNEATTDVAYGGTSTPMYIPLAAETKYTISASAAGETVVGPYKVTLADHQIVSLYATGIVGNDNVPLDVLALEDAPMPQTLDLSSAGTAAVSTALLALSAAAVVVLQL